MSFSKEYFIGPIDLSQGPALTPTTPIPITPIPTTPIPTTQIPTTPIPTTPIPTQGSSAAQYAPTFVYPPGQIPHMVPSSHILHMVHSFPWKPVYPHQTSPNPTYNCQACQFYSGCGIWKNDPYYSCERCIAYTAAGWKRVSDPRAGHSYQNCALNCYCRS